MWCVLWVWSRSPVMGGHDPEWGRSARAKTKFTERFSFYLYAFSQHNYLTTYLNTHIYTYIHTYTHTHIHTYIIHTYIRTSNTLLRESQGQNMKPLISFLLWAVKLVYWSSSLNSFLFQWKEPHFRVNNTTSSSQWRHIAYGPTCHLGDCLSPYRKLRNPHANIMFI